MTYSFASDWFGAHRENWEQWVKPWAEANQPLSVLEIGCADGCSTTWMLENLILDPKSHMVCVDPWPTTGWDGDHPTGRRARFFSNLEKSGKSKQVTVYEQESDDALPRLAAESFDFIYVDGSHFEEQVYRDSINALELVAEGGFIVWDDCIENDVHCSPLRKEVCAGMERALFQIDRDYKVRGNCRVLCA